MLVHLLIILMVGLPFVEITARLLKRHHIDGNVYRTVALCFHIMAFTLSELTATNYLVVFAVSIGAICLVYLGYEVLVDTSDEALATRKAAREQEVQQHEDIIREERSSFAELELVKTYADLHAQIALQQDMELLEVNGIWSKPKYNLVGLLYVQKSDYGRAMELLGLEEYDA